MNAQSVEPIVGAVESAEAILQHVETNKLNDDEISQEPFIGKLTSQTEPLSSSGYDNSNTGNGNLFDGPGTTNSPIKLARFTTLDNMFQSDDNAASSQSSILNKAPTDTIGWTDFRAMISTYKTSRETMGHSEPLLSSPSNAKKSFAVDEGPKLEFAANPPLESNTPTESSTKKLQLNAESMRVLCSDLLTFKWSRVSNLTGFESELRLTITRLEATLKLAKALNKETDKIVSEDMPETESDLKVQSVKLKYYIASSSRAFGRISLQMAELRARMRRYIQESIQFNDGMDELLPRIVTAVCSKQ